MMNESIERVSVNGKRHYQVTLDGEITGTYPSMTTILSNSKPVGDEGGLDRWRESVGHAEADRISNLSMNRGTIMHRLIEIYKGIKGTPESRLNKLHDIASTDEECTQFNEDPNGTIWWDSAWEMFMKFWNHHDEFFDRVKNVIMSEGFVWSKKGFAGTLDNASEMTDNGILIIDYKNSRKPKRDEWIEDYFIQVAGYSVAFYERTGNVPTGCEIWMANEIDEKPQIFKMSYYDIKYYFKEFMNRLRIYNERCND